MDDKDLEQIISDAIMERPYSFYLDDKEYRLYPVTLGKHYLLSRIIESLEISQENLSHNPYMEAMRLCVNKKGEVCRILAYHTLNTKRQIFNDSLVSKRIKLFSEKINIEELAQLLIMVLTNDKTESFIKYFHIDQDRKDMSKIAKVKKDGGNSFNFGGRSIYGSLIGSACEKFGWTLDYVVWGISYTNLRMIIADAVTSIYLTDDEKKKVRISQDRTFVNADDPSNMEKIKALLKG